MEKTIYLPDEQVAKYEKLMEGKVDYDANGLKSYQTIASWTAGFGDGYEVDLKLCSGCHADNDPLWSEAVLFHNGCEVCHTDPDDNLLGDYELEDHKEGKTFIIHMKKLSEKSEIIESVKSPPAEPAGNTQIEFLYRDAENNKVFSTCVINGLLSEEQIDQIMGSLKDGEHFIPDMVGLEGERFSEETEDDGPFFELYRSGFEAVKGKPTAYITPEELTHLFVEAAAKGWGAETEPSVLPTITPFKNPSFKGLITTRIADLESILTNNAQEHPDTEVCEMEAELANLRLARDFWEAFGNVPMDPKTECIESAWNGFEAGTHREYIWHWFEETFGISVAENLMGF